MGLLRPQSSISTVSPPPLIHKKLDLFLDAQNIKVDVNISTEL